MMAVPGLLAAAVRPVPGLKLLVLHGSRARGTSHDRSDWDFGYVGEDALDADALIATLVEATGNDHVGAVDLGRAGALIRHRVARDGILVHETAPGTFDAFRLEAIHTWCDLEPVLTPIYEQALRDVARQER